MTDKKSKIFKKYKPSDIEKKWQQRWLEEGIYASDLSGKKKYYVLAEFAYPSGDLHIGHWFTFCGADILARYKRMQGYSVFFPNGFDAFGLPAENAAIKHNIHPYDWTMSNIQRMKQQFYSMGASFSFDHEVITCLPEYYKWNQWIFLKLLEKGLAYRGKLLSNWCETCQTVLANEAVEAGTCWRCHQPVVQKEIEQWFFKITDYADKLIWPENPSVDWPKSVREAQNDWIGKSEGAVIKFKVQSSKFKVEKQDDYHSERADERDEAEEDYIEVFTTRPDTVFGATFLVVAPEHPIVASLLNLKFKIINLKLEELRRYIDESKRKSELERKESKEKTGVFTGLYAVNPFTKEEIQVWVADYVLPGYGTGAIMAVPAHDQRDLQFAKKFGLDIRTVIVPEKSVTTENTQLLEEQNKQRAESLEQAYEGEGILVNSGKFSGQSSQQAKNNIIKYIEENHIGTRMVYYHIHDWSISRQRYWGTPIPIIYCRKCWELKTQNSKIKNKNIEGKDYVVINGEEYAIIPVPIEDLPVELPYDVDYTPRGKPPLASNEEWLKTVCPVCKGEAIRDAETMDTFVDSSWYFFRYLDPKLDTAPFDPQLAGKMMPVDTYFGGAEHTLGHTLYSRFITKFLKDLGMIEFDEYAQRRINHGVVLGPDGYRMSKSRGNVVNPDDEVQKYGADAVRTYLAFFMPYDGTGPWVSERIWGTYRFLERVWQLSEKIGEVNLSEDDLVIMNKTIKKVGDDIESISFNTAVAALMSWLNHLSTKETVSKQEYTTLLKLLAPIAPHITEELWFLLGEKSSLHIQSWPKFDSNYLQSSLITIAVEVNGKLRDEIVIGRDEVNNEEELKKQVLERDRIKKYIGEKGVKNIIYIPGKIINIVIE